MEFVDYPCDKCHETEEELCATCDKLSKHIAFAEKCKTPELKALLSCNMPTCHKEAIFAQLCKEIQT